MQCAPVSLEKKHGVFNHVQAKLPGCEVWEQRMAHYAKIAEELDALPASLDMGFIRVSVGPLASAVKEEALKWLRAMWECMRSTDMAVLEVGCY